MNRTIVMGFACRSASRCSIQPTCCSRSCTVYDSNTVPALLPHCSTNTKGGAPSSPCLRQMGSTYRAGCATAGPAPHAFLSRRCTRARPTGCSCRGLAEARLSWPTRFVDETKVGIADRSTLTVFGRLVSTMPMMPFRVSSHLRRATKKQRQRCRASSLFPLLLQDGGSICLLCGSFFLLFGDVIDRLSAPLIAPSRAAERPWRPLPPSTAILVGLRNHFAEERMMRCV